MRRFRALQFVGLAAILVLASVVRIDGISKSGFQFDEWWSLQDATGRAYWQYLPSAPDTAYDNPIVQRNGAPIPAWMNIPANKVLDPPPVMGFQNAPPAWTIWFHMDNIYPPVYFILLRGWVDLFGDSMATARGFSSLFSILTVGIMWLAICWQKDSSESVTLFASFLMAIAVSQIEYAQNARPYTLIVCIGMAVIAVVFYMERFGISAVRLACLTGLIFFGMLSHYFAALPILSAAGYVLLKFKGRERMKILGAFASGFALFLIVWGYWLVDQLSWLHNVNADFFGGSERMTLGMVFQSFALVSMHLLIGEFTDMPLPAILLVIAIVIVASIRGGWRSAPWLLWLMCAIGTFLIRDVIRSAMFGSGVRILTMERFLFIASPGGIAIVGMYLLRSKSSAIWNRIDGGIASLGILTAILLTRGYVDQAAARFPMMDQLYSPLAVYLGIGTAAIAFFCLCRTAWWRESRIWPVAVWLLIGLVLSFEIDVGQSFLTSSPRTGWMAVVIGVVVLALTAPGAPALRYVGPAAICLLMIQHLATFLEKPAVVNDQIVSVNLDAAAGPRDLLVFSFHPDTGNAIPQIPYAALQCYTHTTAARPVILLVANSKDGSTYPTINVTGYDHAWIVSDYPDEDIRHCFPHWNIVRRLPTVITAQTVEMVRVSDASK